MNVPQMTQLFSASLLSCCLIAGLVLSAAPAQAEPVGITQPSGPPLLSLSAAPYYQLPSSLNHGGKVAVTNLSLDLNSNIAISRALGVGFHLGYDYTDYRFSGPVALAGLKPWGDINRLEMGVNVSYDFTPELSLYIIPSLQFTRESDASWGKAIAYGGVVTVAYDFTPGLTLGTGVAAFNDLDKVSVLPVIVVKWQITDKLLLTNPLRPGPTGPAGLELSYTPVKHWDLAAGTTYRSNRFRLGSSGTVKEGIGESDVLPAFGRLTWKPAKYFSTDLYAGVMFGGSLFVNDRNNTRISSDHYNPAPFGALAVSGHF